MTSNQKIYIKPQLGRLLMVCDQIVNLAIAQQVVIVIFITAYCTVAIILMLGSVRGKLPAVMLAGNTQRKAA